MGAEPPETDPPQGFDIGDRELDQLIADWEAVDRQAARVLREALGEYLGLPIPDGDPDAISSRMRDGLAAGVYPFDWIGRAAGLVLTPSSLLSRWRDTRAAPCGSQQTLLRGPFRPDP